MSKFQLTTLQKDVLSFIGKSPFCKNFYWTGGTLLSYFYFMHRNSVDLDFFSADLFSDFQYISFINDLKLKVGANKISETLQLNRRIYNIVRGREIVKLEFVFFPFRSLKKKKTIEEFNIKIDSLADIMINKTLSAYQRNEPKDIYDLYCYLSGKPEYKIVRLVALVEKKFGVSIEITLLLSKINELADSLSVIKPLLINHHKNLSKEIKNFFQEEFNSLAKRKIK